MQVLTEAHQLLHISRHLMKRVDYVGIAEFEFKFCQRRQQFYLIEVNGRFPLHSALLQHANPTFLHGIITDLVGDVPQLRKRKNLTKPVAWLYAINDIRALKVKDIIPAYFKLFHTYHVQAALWSFGDVRPAVAHIKYLVCKMIWKRKASNMNVSLLK
nr:hypothetical protein [Lentibacillus saliphilus]